MPEPFPKCPRCDHSWHGLPCVQSVGWDADAKTTRVCDCETAATNLYKPPDD